MKHELKLEDIRRLRERTRSTMLYASNGQLYVPAYVGRLAYGYSIAERNGKHWLVFRVIRGSPVSLKTLKKVHKTRLEGVENRRLTTLLTSTGEWLVECPEELL